MQLTFVRATQRVIDVSVLSLALTLAFFVRFDWNPPLPWLARLMLLLPYVVGVQYLTLAAFGIPRFAWRYVGLRETSRILLATGCMVAPLIGLRFVAEALPTTFVRSALIPLGVILIDLVLVFLGITGVRIFRRLLAERGENTLRAPVQQRQTLLLGAGQAGVLVAREVGRRRDLGIRPVGFLDDAPEKQGQIIHGLRVLGTTDRLAQIAARHRVEQVLITIAGNSGRAIRRIAEACEVAALPVKIIPGVHEIVGGKVDLSGIRAVAIEDLLRREPLDLDMHGIAAFIQGKVVVVTGAGGSIGSEICRQVARFGPRQLLLVERYENALFEIHRELGGRPTEVAITPCVADVTDAQRMRSLFRKARPDVIFHSAAHKHVPMMEWNPGEALKNNVLGTQVVADLAAELGVRQFVMISTDKAVNPTGVMGASKRVAELYVQCLAQRAPSTRFVSVRFGNVLGSSGSVVPIFKEQIAHGGPVTVTHPEMRRYFMTIPEATQLVLQAASFGRGGEIFILDMGKPVRITDLAHDLIRLSGLEPDRDIEIEYSGIRPGEKLVEELTTSEESATRTTHHKIFVAQVKPAEWDSLVVGIDDLLQRADSLDERRVYEGLAALIPEFNERGDRPSKPGKVVPLPR